VPCSPLADFTTNLTICTANEDMRFYDWEVTYKAPTPGMLATQHLIEFEIKNFTWENITPVINNPTFFGNLQGAF
jgi:hypothetical protein